MPFSVTANVTSGTGTAVTWNIPTYVMGDYIMLSVQANSTSTTSTISGTDANFTFSRNPPTGTGNTYPTWLGRRYAPNLSVSNTGTLSVSSGWRAVAVVIHGTKGLVGTQDWVAAQNNHTRTPQSYAIGECFVVVNHGRLAATGTSTVTSGGAAWSEVLDSYASNLQTSVHYYGPETSAHTDDWVSTWSTSSANTTRGTALRVWTSGQGLLSEAPYGPIAASLPAFESSFTGDVDDTVTGAMSATLPQFTADLDATVKTSGSISATLPEFTSSISVTVETSGALAAVLPEFLADLDVTVETSGALAGILPEFTADLDGTVTALPSSGPLAAELPEFTADLDAAVKTSGSLSATLPEMTAALTGGLSDLSAVLAATLPEFLADVDGTVKVSGSISATLPEFAADLDGTADISGTFAATLPEFSADLDATVETSGALSATLPQMQATFTAEFTFPGEIEAALPEMTASLSGTVTVPPLPAARRVDVLAENRVAPVKPESRIVTVKSRVDDRIITVKQYSRFVKVPTEDRYDVV